MLVMSRLSSLCHGGGLFVRILKREVIGPTKVLSLKWIALGYGIHILPLRDAHYEKLRFSRPGSHARRPAALEPPLLKKFQ
jgi:hypothetical protein